MHTKHPVYLEWPLPIHHTGHTGPETNRHDWPGWRRHWRLILGLAVLLVLLIGVTVSGGRP